MSDDQAEEIRTQLCELHVRPRADAADILAATLGMAQRTLQRYSAALRDEGHGQ